MNYKEQLSREQITIYNKNYAKAVQHFKLPKGWVLHHKDVSLRHNDIDRYIQWNPEDLIPMTKSEHMAYHNSVNEYTDERRQKISRSMMGNTNGRNGGKATKGMHWYTNGVVKTKAFECQEGYWLGMTIYH